MWLSRDSLDALQVSGPRWETGRFLGVVRVVADEGTVAAELLLLSLALGLPPQCASTVFNLRHAMGSRVFWSLSVHITKPQYQLTTVSSLHSREVSVWKIGKVHVKSEETRPRDPGT